MEGYRETERNLLALEQRGAVAAWSRARGAEGMGVATAPAPPPYAPPSPPEPRTSSLPVCAVSVACHPAAAWNLTRVKEGERQRMERAH